MSLFLFLLVLLVVGVVVAVATGLIGGGLPEPTSTVPPHGLPPGPVTAEALDDVRFAPALRGYRMDQVDSVIDALRAELARRDEWAAGGGTPPGATGVPGGDDLFRPTVPSGPGAGRVAGPLVAEPLVAEPGEAGTGRGDREGAAGFGDGVPIGRLPAEGDDGAPPASPPPEERSW